MNEGQIENLQGEKKRKRKDRKKCVPENMPRLKPIKKLGFSGKLRERGVTAWRLQGG